MSDLANGIISSEPPQQCDECGEVRELRPYGKNGACICCECGMTPKHKGAAEQAMKDRLNAFHGKA